MDSDLPAATLVAGTNTGDTAAGTEVAAAPNISRAGGIEDSVNGSPSTKANAFPPGLVAASRTGHALPCAMTPRKRGPGAMIEGGPSLRGALSASHADSLESDEMWSESEPESEPEEEELVWGANTFCVPQLSRQFSRMGGDFELEHSGSG